MNAGKFVSDVGSGPVRRRLTAAGAFTLVELLVVIGIIALLVSILMPALSRAQQMAKQTACLSNLRNMGNAVQMYMNDNHNFYPGHCHKNSANITYAIWPVKLRHYMNGNQAIFWCPAALELYQWPVTPGPTAVAEPATNEDGQWGYNTGEQLLDVFAVQFSYGYNDWGCGGPQGAPPATTATQRGCGGDIDWYSTSAANQCHTLNATRVRNPSELIMISDKQSNGNWNFDIDPTDSTQCPAQRHTTGSNCLFADGHAEWKQEQDIVVFNVKTAPQATNPNSTTLAPDFAVGSAQWNNAAPLWNNDNQP